MFTYAPALCAPTDPDSIHDSQMVDPISGDSSDVQCTSQGVQVNIFQCIGANRDHRYKPKDYYPLQQLLYQKKMEKKVRPSLSIKALQTKLPSMHY